MISDLVVPVILMPLFLFLAAQGWFWTLGGLSLLTFFLGSYQYLTLRRRTRTRFFFSWALTSLIFLLGVFELEVVPYLEILFSENFILMCFVLVAIFCAYFTRLRMTANLSHFPGSDSVKDCESERSSCETCGITKSPRSIHCKLCGLCVLRRDHHCIWLDTCIGAKNYRFYVGFLIAALFSCCYAANLTLTTVCRPVLFLDTFLLPRECNDVYGDIHIALCYVSALYMVIIACGALLKLLQQGCFMCHRYVMRDWTRAPKKEHQMSCLSRLVDSCCSHH